MAFDSYGWGHNGEEGSSDTPDNVFYRGPAPFSEPETAAVRVRLLQSLEYANGITDTK